MPKVKVNDIDIYYEAYGKGPTVCWVQDISPWAYYLAGRLSYNYRIIILDNPNSGQSGSILKDAPSEWHIDCEYLYGLCKTLGELSVHFVGGTGGGEQALLMAHLYPDIVKSVAMSRPSDMTNSIYKDIVSAKYYALAEIAETGDMGSVIEYSANPPETRWGSLSKWLHELTRRSPSIKKQLLSYNPKDFALLMRKWGDWMGNKWFYRANLNDSELQAIKVPVLIVPSADPLHPEEIAKDLYSKLPNAKYVPSATFRNENEMYGAAGEEHPFGGLVDFIPHLEQFLNEITR